MAPTVTPRAAVTVEPSIVATTTSPRMFSATAPAPLSEIAKLPLPMPMPIEMPTARASTGEVERATTVTIEPETTAPPRIAAVIVLLTEFVAVATATDTEPPVPIDPEMLPAPTSAFNSPALTALTRTSPAAVTVPPWMAASTWSVWLLLAMATATEMDRANDEPAEMAMLTATTRAVADGVVGVSAWLVARTTTSPFETTFEATTRARTCTAVTLRASAPAPESAIAAESPTVIETDTAIALASTPPT